MKCRWCFAVLLVIVLVSSCSNGDSRLNVDDGNRLADKTRRPIAETYWQLYDAIGNSVSQGGGNGVFTHCEDAAADSLIYRVDNLLTARKGGKESTERLAAIAAKRLANIGWKLKPSYGVRRSAIRNGVKVEVRPTGINDWSIVLQAQSDCVDFGAAADVIEDAYYTTVPDRYPSSRAMSSPVPTGFPEANASGS
jgi:hypothetical protein